MPLYTREVVEGSKIEELEEIEPFNGQEASSSSLFIQFHFTFELAPSELKHFTGLTTFI